MTKIKLNNEEFEINTFTRTTFFGDEAVKSFANFEVVSLDLEKMTALAANIITVLQIYHNNDLIYDLQNTNIHIDNVNDLLNNDTVTTTVNLTFNI